MRKNLDIGGIAVSVGCLLHCVLLPYFLTSLSVFGIDILSNIFVELLLVVIAGVIGVLSFKGGLKAHHRKLPVSLFIIGFSVLISKLFVHKYEAMLSAIALTTIICAHVYNFWLVRKFCDAGVHVHKLGRW